MEALHVAGGTCSRPQVGKITANHPEEFDERALLFWEFFEAAAVSCCAPAELSSNQVVMESCRGLVAGLGTPLDKDSDLALHKLADLCTVLRLQAIPAYVQTMLVAA